MKILFYPFTSFERKKMLKQVTLKGNGVTWPSLQSTKVIAGLFRDFQRSFRVLQGFPSTSRNRLWYLILRILDNPSSYSFQILGCPLLKHRHRRNVTRNYSISLIWILSQDILYHNISLIHDKKFISFLTRSFL